MRGWCAQAELILHVLEQRFQYYLSCFCIDLTKYLCLSISPRSHLEKDRMIEDLKQKLHTKENELEKLFQRNHYLEQDSRYLADVVQHLNQRVAELEADKQEAREKIRALLNRRSTKAPAKLPPKPSVDHEHLRQVSRLTHELNVSTKQLGSTVRHALVDLQNHFQQLRELVEKMTEAEQHRVLEQEEVRSLYMKEALERKTLYNKLLELQGNIRVFCRCRGNTSSNSCLEVSSEQEIVVIQKGGKKKLNFDRVYSPNSTQVRQHYRKGSFYALLNI